MIVPGANSDAPETAKNIYSTCSEKLKDRSFHTRALLTKMKVEVVCTTDDPIDSLEHHQKIKRENYSVNILPTFRPDKAYAIENISAYNSYLEKLSQVSGVQIVSFSTLISSLENRIDFFHANGCTLSDHGLEQLYYPELKNSQNIDLLFLKIKKQEKLNTEETHYFKYCVLIELGRLYHKKGWIQQFHLGALRNTDRKSVV